MGTGAFLVSITNRISATWLSSGSDIEEGAVSASVVSYAGLNGNSHD